MTQFDKTRLPSRHVSVGPERAPHRSYYYAMGLSEEDIAKPFVALASAGDWLAATRRRLRAVEDAFPANAAEASEASESAIQEALASTLSEYASRITTCRPSHD